MSIHYYYLTGQWVGYMLVTLSMVMMVMVSEGGGKRVGRKAKCPSQSQ